MCRRSLFLVSYDLYKSVPWVIFLIQPLLKTDLNRNIYGRIVIWIILLADSVHAKRDFELRPAKWRQRHVSRISCNVIVSPTMRSGGLPNAERLAITGEHLCRRVGLISCQQIDVSIELVFGLGRNILQSTSLKRTCRMESRYGTLWILRSTGCAFFFPKLGSGWKHSKRSRSRILLCQNSFFLDFISLGLLCNISSKYKYKFLEAVLIC